MEENTVTYVRRGNTTAYVARIVELSAGTLKLPAWELEGLLGGNDNVVSQMETYLKYRWGAVVVTKKLGRGLYLCSGPDDVLKAFVSAPPGKVSFFKSRRQENTLVYDTTIIGLHLEDNLNIAS